MNDHETFPFISHEFFRELHEVLESHNFETRMVFGGDSAISTDEAALILQAAKCWRDYLADNLP